jgi:hypothetical protein
MTTNLYTEILKFKQMTINFDRESLISDYAEQIIDGMDMDTLTRFAFDMLVENVERLSDKDLISEVNEYTPELLEEYNIDPDIYI